MVFSSITFIFYFLPLVLLAYYIAPRKMRNLILLISSLFFYFYGEKMVVLLLVFSIVFHYFWGKVIERHSTKGNLAIGIAVDLLLLGYFKYSNFFLDNIELLLGREIFTLNIILPIGISFFTFQGISYLIDVYRHDVKAAKSLVSFGAYLSLFPQLIAGPIVRYETVAEELESRKESVDDFYRGILRFVTGLSKKVILADTLGGLVAILGALESKTILSLWLEALAATLQLYFDFSAYSDMAIGLGLFFGFHFLENFNYPLTARSITDFWRRWHISLSSWFKDYVYIPLGGSRVKRSRHIFNILVVWLLTGFWHGADWNFIFWGLYFAFILLLEKYFYLRFLDKHSFLGRIYSIVVVMVGFVIFNHNDLRELLFYLGGMFGLEGLPFADVTSLYYLRSYTVLLVVAMIGMTPLMKRLSTFLKERYAKPFSFVEVAGTMLLFVVVVAFILDATFMPFLYFRF